MTFANPSLSSKIANSVLQPMLLFGIVRDGKEQYLASKTSWLGEGLRCGFEAEEGDEMRRWFVQHSLGGRRELSAGTLNVRDEHSIFQPPHYMTLALFVPYLI